LSKSSDEVQGPVIVAAGGAFAPVERPLLLAHHFTRKTIVFAAG
jgi:hypothetical protein